MPAVNHPGVYVQEMPGGVRTIVGVDTAIGLFVGRSLKGEAYKPVRCRSMDDFERAFGTDYVGSDMARAVRLFFQNGGGTCHVVRIADLEMPGGTAAPARLQLQTGTGHPSLLLEAKSIGAFGNDIGIAISYAADAEATFDMELFRRTGTDAGQKADIETYVGLGMDPTGTNYVCDVLAAGSRLVKATDVSAVPMPGTAQGNGDAPRWAASRPAPTDELLFGGAGMAGDDGGAPGGLDYDRAYREVDSQIDLFNLLVLPRDTLHSNAAARSLWAPASIFCRSRRAFLLIDPPDDWTDARTAVGPAVGVDTLRAGLAKDHSAIFFPRIKMIDAGAEVTVGPSGAIAGLIGRIDASRGVWKAPAGIEADLRGVTGVEKRFSEGENDVMNPRAINLIRALPGGIVNWGARTLDGDDSFASDYKYIPVRRLALFIEESLSRGLAWAAFEPNDEPLWAQLRLEVGTFMNGLYRQGAFQGRTPAQAYFVKCDGSTTTQNDRDLGIVNLLVGFAPLKPAEFVVLTLRQVAGAAPA